MTGAMTTGTMIMGATITAAIFDTIFAIKRKALKEPAPRALPQTGLKSPAPAEALPQLQDLK
jgi:hypothetical protein